MATKWYRTCLQLVRTMLNGSIRFPIKLVTNSCFCLSFAIHLLWLGIWRVGWIANPSHIFPLVAISGYRRSPFVDYRVSSAQGGQEGSAMQPSPYYACFSPVAIKLGKP